MLTDKNARIAIIGAGVSGIFTAVGLKKRGYHNITLYEKAPRITSLTQTFSYGQHRLDLSTKLIPAIGLSHDGIYPPLLELLQETGISLEKTPVPAFYDFSRGRRMAIPALMQQYSRLKVIRDFAKAYGLLARVNACASFPEIYQTDVIRAGETIADWAGRHNIAAFGSFTDYLVDLFNMGPAHQVPAAFVLVSRIHFVAPYLHAILGRRGVKHYYKLFPPRPSPGFRDFLDFKPKTTNYYVVKEGYETFFQRLVQHYDLQVECQATVSNLRKEEGGLGFTLNGDRQVSCDKVIFCIPPPAIAQLTFLPKVKHLTQPVQPGRIIRSWVFEVEKWNEKAFGRSAYLIDGTNKLGLGTRNMALNGELMYVSKEIADSNLVISPVYLEPGKTEENHLQALHQSLGRFDLQVKKVLACQDFTWPHYASLEQDKAGWHATFQDLQGQEGMYYSGESFSGIGVPTILQFTQHFLHQHFN
ncbi:MAG: FAD-dependent oxidoreductase [Adhaeribacter sp.]